MDNCCCGGPKSSWAPPKASWGKCERGRGNINADGAGAEVFASDEHSRERLFCPMALISRLWRGGRIIIIRVRASGNGECALSPADLTTHSPPKAFAHPRTATRSSRAFSHSLPALFRSPTQRRCIPRRPHNPFPAEALRSPPHSDTPFPSTSAPPHSADARPQAARCIPRRPHTPFPAAPRCLPFRSTSGTKKRHRTVHVRCRMFRSTVVAVGHLGW